MTHAGTKAAEVWLSLPEKVRKAIAAAVHIDIVREIPKDPATNKPVNPPLFLFPVGNLALVISAWRPNGLLLSQAFRPNGGEFADPKATRKDGSPKPMPKDAPTFLDRPAWYGPLAGMIAGAKALMAAGWTVRQATDYADAVEKAEEASEEGTAEVLARVAIPGSSSRVGAATAEPVSPQTAAALLAELPD